MMRNDDGKPSMRRTILTHLLCVVLGALLSGAVVYKELDKRWWNHWQLANRQRKGDLAKMAALTLARLRTGTVDDAIPFLEDTVDRFIVSVPMGENYSELSYECQHAMATCKVYRSRFAFSPEWCKWCGPGGLDLHSKHTPSLLADVPLLDADHEWLDGPMRKVRQMPALVADSDEKSLP
jgi:hypothetical protein